MKYYEVTVDTTSEASELVAEILTEAGSNGIGIYDVNDLKDIADRQPDSMGLYGRTSIGERRQRAGQGIFSRRRV